MEHAIVGVELNVRFILNFVVVFLYSLQQIYIMVRPQTKRDNFVNGKPQEVSALESEDSW